MELYWIYFLHYYLFQDLYPWAGEIRRSELAKLDLFCLYDNIEYFANIIFSKLKEENYIDLTDDSEDENNINKNEINNIKINNLNNSSNKKKKIFVFFRFYNII